MKSVVICGSGKFKTEIRKFAKELIDAGVTVYEPYLHTGSIEWDKMSLQYKKFVILGLTHDHFYKIRMADVVYLYNKDGYSGNSSTLELGYATALGKPIYAYSEKDAELARLVLFRGVIPDSKEFIKKLK